MPSIKSAQNVYRKINLRIGTSATIEDYTFDGEEKIPPKIVFPIPDISDIGYRTIKRIKLNKILDWNGHEVSISSPLTFKAGNKEIVINQDALINIVYDDIYNDHQNTHNNGFCNVTNVGEKTFQTNKYFLNSEQSIQIYNNSYGQEFIANDGKFFGLGRVSDNYLSLVDPSRSNRIFRSISEFSLNQEYLFYSGRLKVNNTTVVDFKVKGKCTRIEPNQSQSSYLTDKYFFDVYYGFFSSSLSEITFPRYSTKKAIGVGLYKMYNDGTLVGNDMYMNPSYILDIDIYI